MFNDDGHSMEVARLLELAATRADEMGAGQIIPIFDEAEAACLELVSSEEFRLEVRRRVAEWKMKLHCIRDSAFGTVEALHKNVVDLGYSNLDTEGTVEIYFAQYCERQGRLNEARQILQRLRIKLESGIEKEGLGAYRPFDGFVEKMLSRIDARGQQ